MFDIFKLLDWFADFVIRDVLKLSIQTKLTESIHFYI